MLLLRYCSDLSFFSHFSRIEAPSDNRAPATLLLRLGERASSRARRCRNASILRSIDETAF